jgi:phage protein U
VQIGTFGPIIFEVADAVARTFKNLDRKVPSRWAVHEILGAKPMAEFIGPGQQSIDLPVTLNALLLDGHELEDEIMRIESMIEKGKVDTLVIGEYVYGKWYVDSASFGTRYFGARGEYTHAEVTLSLKEYPEKTEEETE